jgi:hypothetical protein
MNELIRVTINEQGSKTVSARALYQFLEIKSKFIDWIKNRINKYGFIENQDFITVSKNLENGGIEKDNAEVDYSISAFLSIGLGVKIKCYFPFKYFGLLGDHNALQAQYLAVVLSVALAQSCLALKLFRALSE